MSRHRESDTSRLKFFEIPLEISPGSRDEVLVAIFSAANENGRGAEYRGAISWGDGSAQTPARIAREGDLFRVYGSHFYEQSGEYDVAVEVASADLRGSIKESARVGTLRQRYVAWLVSKLFSKRSNPTLVAYANRLLERGLSEPQLVRELLRMPEFRLQWTETAYEKYLRRKPDEQESAEAGQLLEKGGAARLLVQLASSEEYYGKAGGSDGYLDALANDFCEPSIPPLGFLMSSEGPPNSIQRRTTLVDALLRSAPARLRTIREYYAHFLGRPPRHDEVTAGFDQADDPQSMIGRLAQPLNFLSPTGLLTIPKPDLYLQVVPDFDGLSAIAGTDVKAKLSSDTQALFLSLRNDFGPTLQKTAFTSFDELFPKPELRLVSWQGQGRGGVWLAGAPTPGSDMELAGLGTLDGELYSVTLSAVALAKLVAVIWANLPKRLNTHGHIDPDGDITLNDYELSLDDQTLRLEVFGTFHFAASDIGLSVRYTSTFTGNPAGGVLSHGDSHFGFTSGVDWVAALHAMSYFLVPFTLEEIPIDYLGIRDPDVPPFDLGAMLAKVFPATSLLEGTKKLVFRYSAVTVDPEVGIRASGIDAPIEDRVPRVFVVGPLEIFYPDYLAQYVVVPASSPGLVALKLTYYAQTQDMRGQVTCQWTVDGAPRSQSGTSIDVKWEFDPHRPSHHTIGVAARDEDGLTANAFVTIQFLATPRSKPEAPPVRKPFVTSESGAGVR